MSIEIETVISIPEDILHGEKKCSKVISAEDHFITQLRNTQLEINIVAWDIKHAINLISKANPSQVEIFQSPVKFIEDSQVIEPLRKLIYTKTCRTRLAYARLHLSKGTGLIGFFASFFFFLHRISFNYTFSQCVQICFQENACKCKGLYIFITSYSLCVVSYIKQIYSESWKVRGCSQNS